MIFYSDDEIMQMRVGSIETGIEKANKEIVKLRSEVSALLLKLEVAEKRAEKAEREMDEFKAKYIEAVNRACALSKIIDESGLEE